MNLMEKAAYLRGLYDGLGFKEDGSAKARMFDAIISVIEELSSHVSENEESINTMADQMDEVSEVLDEVADLLRDTDADDEDELEDEDYDEEDDITEFEVECPKCAAPIVIDEETLESGRVVCSACGQKFSIDIGYESEDGNGEDADEAEADE